jgi:DivIVA domain-containing protein
VNGDEVRAVRFGAGRFEAYAAGEVDDLLRRVAAELDAGRPVGPLIERFSRRRSVLFRTRSTEGYDVDAVDWFLGHLLLPADRSELAGIGGDPWRDLGEVAQLTRCEVSGPVKHPAGQAWLASYKHLSEECASAWRDFGQEPGIRLRWERVKPGSRELRTAEGQTIASLGRRVRVQTVSIGGRSFTLKKIRPAPSEPPGLAEILARSERDFDGHFAKNRHGWLLLNDPLDAPRRRVRELADEAGTPILYTGGLAFAHRAWASITFPDQRWLRFLVRGTDEGNAIMTAVDQAGNKAVRYRRQLVPGTFGRNLVEITVHPDWKLTDELALAIAISAPWLRGYFQTGGGG